MTSLIAVFLSLLLIYPADISDKEQQKWGQTGHRIVGDIADDYLDKKAEMAISKILEHESMAIASTWMDKIRSDSRYDYTHAWHWVTIPDGMTYEETEKNPDGDLVNALQTIITELKEGNLSEEEKVEKLRMLIHLVGDLHQPMHVGTGEDRGGNDTKVEWFYEPSNLHRVWDSEIIDDTKLSYTEFSNAVNHPTEEQLREWQQGDVLDWAHESMEYREQIYDLPDDSQIGYQYQYNNRDLLDRQLLKAGVRLAYVLNQIYG